MKLLCPYLFIGLKTLTLHLYVVSDGPYVSKFCLWEPSGSLVQILGIFLTVFLLRLFHYLLHIYKSLSSLTARLLNHKLQILLSSSIIGFGQRINGLICTGWEGNIPLKDWLVKDLRNGLLVRLVLGGFLRSLFFSFFWLQIFSV